METLGGVTDNTKNAKKTFPRAVIIATVFMTLSYVVSIFICGISANWLKDLSGSNINLGNVRYFMVTNLGSMFGEKALHMNAANSVVLGQWISRFMSLTGFISYFGEFLFLIYAPIKSFIEGSPKDFWPKKMTKLNQNGIPSFALWIQTLVVCLIVLGVSFGGSTAQAFYTILTDMNNITTAVPYLFLVVAFPFFKKNFANNQVGAIFYHRRITINFVTVITMATLALSIIFTSLQPILDHDLQTAFWTVFGPVFFIIVAWIFYNRANKKKLKIKKRFGRHYQIFYFACFISSLAVPLFTFNSFVIISILSEKFMRSCLTLFTNTLFFIVFYNILSFLFVFTL